MIRAIQNTNLARLLAFSITVGGQRLGFFFCSAGPPAAMFKLQGTD